MCHLNDAIGTPGLRCKRLIAWEIWEVGPKHRGTISGKSLPDSHQLFRDDTFDTPAKCQYPVSNCCREGT